MTTARALIHRPESHHPAFMAGEQALVGVAASYGLEGDARRAWLLGIATAALRSAGLLDVQIGRQEVRS